MVELTQMPVPRIIEHPEPQLSQQNITINSHQLLLMQRRNKLTSYNDLLGPWDSNNDSDDQELMHTYCDQLLPILRTKKAMHQKINSKYYEMTINAEPSQCKRRPKSNVTAVNNENKESRGNIFQRLSATNRKDTITSILQKSVKIDRKQSSCLQEIYVHNYVLQGEARENARDPRKRKQAVFAMKHKFAQIRKSLSIPHQQPHSRIRQHIRDNQQNVILKLTRYGRV